MSKNSPTMNGTLKVKVPTKDKDGNPLTLALLPPSAKVRQEARLVHAKSYRDAVAKGSTTSSPTARCMMIVETRISRRMVGPPAWTTTSKETATPPRLTQP
jgi:hypothetical protein